MTATPFSRFLYDELQRRRGSPTAALAAVMATPPSLVAFGAIRLLMRVAPDTTRVREELLEIDEGLDNLARAAGAGPERVHPLMKVFAALYRGSLLYAYLHRDGAPCLFVPSCTEFTVRAVSKHGIYRGLLLAGDRFRRCNGAYKGAYVDFP